MKHRISIVLSALALLGVIFIIISDLARVNADSKIAFFDTKQVLTSYPEFIELSEKLIASEQAYQQEFKSMINAMQANLKEYEINRLHMSVEEAEIEEQKLKSKQVEIENYSQKIKTEIQEKNAEAIVNVTAEVNGIIQEFGKENNYQLILSANRDGALAYADGAIDITDDIIDLFKKN